LRELRVVGGAWVRGGRVFVARRGPGMSAAGDWEFPGGKVEAGESPEEALARELWEELGITAAVGAWVGQGVEERAALRVVLDVYRVDAPEPAATLREHDQGRWVSAAELPSVAFGAADVPVVPAVRALLGGDS
jgi:8-oxo-dGTP diphosphatase